MPIFLTSLISGVFDGLKKCSPLELGGNTFIPKLIPTKSSGIGRALGDAVPTVTVTVDGALAAPTTN
jgi:hypothetical protein